MHPYVCCFALNQSFIYLQILYDRQRSVNPRLICRGYYASFQSKKLYRFCRVKNVGFHTIFAGFRIFAVHSRSRPRESKEASGEVMIPHVFPHTNTREPDSKSGIQNICRTENLVVKSVGMAF